MKLGNVTQEESLNNSLPALARRPNNLSNFVNFSVRKNSESKLESVDKLRQLLPPVVDSKLLLTPSKPFPHKRLPVLSAGKKHFTVISKSKSSSEFTPLVSPTVTDEPKTPKTPIKVIYPKSPVVEPKKDPFINETFTEYYYQTMPGFSDGRTKTNQDSFYVNISVHQSTKCSLYAVFDGHGPLGHKVSDFLKRNLTGSLS